MRREWTMAALFALLVAGSGTASAQEERVPAHEVRHEAVERSAPAPAPLPAPAPAPSASPVSAPAGAPVAAFGESGQARPRTGGSPATSGSRGRSGSSSGSGASDNRGRSRAPSPSSSGGSSRSGSAVSAPSGSDVSVATGSDSASAERRRYPYRGEGAVTGQAVRRGTVRPVYGRGWYYPSHPWYGSWYPYGFGSWGLGFYMWDPYWYGGGYGYPYAYGYGYPGRYDDTGSVRTIVKPKDAQVFVDGYYVGVVDEFDGAFQRLRLDTGPHRIEIRKDGFETMRFDVRITIDHTITLRGELKPAAGGTW